MNHFDVVQRLRPQLDDANTGTMLAWVLKVIAVLPASERVGLVKAPASGENVAVYNGTPVRVNRVIYPDGQMYKILTDSGPGGTNGAAWNQDDVEPDLYVPVAGGPVPVPEPTPTPSPTPTPGPPQVPGVLWVDVFPLTERIAALEQKIQILIDKPDPVVSVPPPGFPAYEGDIKARGFSIWKVRLEPKP